MLYAILAYHVESEVMSWTPEEDAAVMAGLRKVQEPLRAKGHFGPTARLDATGKARTLRGPGAGVVLDGPFAETKEQLLGFYIMDFADEAGAIAQPESSARPIRARFTKSAQSSSSSRPMGLARHLRRHESALAVRAWRSDDTTEQECAEGEKPQIPGILRRNSRHDRS